MHNARDIMSIEVSNGNLVAKTKFKTIAHKNSEKARVVDMCMLSKIF